MTCPLPLASQHHEHQVRRQLSHLPSPMAPQHSAGATVLRETVAGEGNLVLEDSPT